VSAAACRRSGCTPAELGGLAAVEVESLAGPLPVGLGTDAHAAPNTPHEPAGEAVPGPGRAGATGPVEGADDGVTRIVVIPDPDEVASGAARRPATPSESAAHGATVQKNTARENTARDGTAPRETFPNVTPPVMTAPIPVGPGPRKASPVPRPQQAPEPGTSPGGRQAKGPSGRDTESPATRREQAPPGSGGTAPPIGIRIAGGPDRDLPFLGDDGRARRPAAVPFIAGRAPAPAGPAHLPDGPFSDGPLPGGALPEGSPTTGPPPGGLADSPPEARRQMFAHAPAPPSAVPDAGSTAVTAGLRTGTPAMITPTPSLTTVAPTATQYAGPAAAPQGRYEVDEIIAELTERLTDAIIDLGLDEEV
jgi:hypothetical protein